MPRLSLNHLIFLFILLYLLIGIACFFVTGGNNLNMVILWPKDAYHGFLTSKYFN